MKKDNSFVSEMIKKFKVNKEVKEKLLIFNNCLNRKNSNINVIIDNMSVNDIKKYYGYLKKIIISNNCLNNLVNFSDRDYFKLKNKIVLIDLDCDLIWKIYENEDYVNKVLGSYVSNNNIVIIISIDKIDKYDSFKKIDIVTYLPCLLFRGEMDEKKEYNLLLNKYKKNNIECKISRNSFIKIYDNIKNNELVNSLKLSDYLYDYSMKSYNFNKNNVVDIKSFAPIIKIDNKNENINIDKLIGLDNVKHELNSLFNYAEFLKENHFNQNDTYLNMFFLGNPGTGKTMIANYVADKLYEMGFIKENKIVKVIPTDLIGEYVGHTRRKIRKILDEAKGKVLFIDEAYLLYNGDYKGGNNPFMQEAVVELLKYLENPTNITIMAGYKDKMQAIYKVNPGIKSRIYKEIIFDDYNVKELYQILKNELKEKGLKISSEATLGLKNYIKSIKTTASFGNARSIKQLSQKLIINHVNSMKNDFIISENDIPKEEYMVKKMGFGD